MHTTITSVGFQKKVKNKYHSDYIERIIETVSLNPHVGMSFNAVNNIFILALDFTINKKAEYNLVYYYQGKNQPLYIINIFKKKEKDVLSKIITSLIDENNL